MKRKKRIIALFISFAASILLGVSAFAAFRFTRKVDGSAETGEINIVSQKFLNYAPKTLGEYDNTSAYLTNLKSRVDSNFYVVTDVNSTNVTSYYTIEATASDTYDDTNGTIYVKDDSGNYYQSSSIPTGFVDEHFYQVVGTRAKKYSSSVTYYEKTAYQEAATGSIEAYATERLGYSEDDYTKPYLNQLGFIFSFTANVDVYIRIHFEDAWLSQKTYTNGYSETKYVTKDKLSDDSSPFEVFGDDSNWVFDTNTNSCYYKEPISVSSEVHKYSFDVSNSYFYTTATGTAYREAIKVRVAYSLDIVQANRAYAIWGVDPSSLSS